MMRSAAELASERGEFRLGGDGWLELRLSCRVCLAWRVLDRIGLGMGSVGGLVPASGQFSGVSDVKVADVSYPTRPVPLQVAFPRLRLLRPYSLKLRTTRKPKPGNRSPSAPPARCAARRLEPPPRHAPPRSTRIEPPEDAAGSDSGECL